MLKLVLLFASHLGHGVSCHSPLTRKMKTLLPSDVMTGEATTASPAPGSSKATRHRLQLVLDSVAVRGMLVAFDEGHDGQAILKNFGGPASLADVCLSKPHRLVREERTAKIKHFLRAVVRS